MAKFFQYAFMALMALIFVPQMWAEYQDGKNSPSWPSTSGELVDGVIKEVVTEDEHFQRHNFELVVDYTYEVDGRSYHGHRIRAGGKSYMQQSQALEDLHRLQDMSELTVFYNPDKPESSVLEHR